MGVTRMRLWWRGCCESLAVRRVSGAVRTGTPVWHISSARAVSCSTPPCRELSSHGGNLGDRGKATGAGASPGRTMDLTYEKDEQPKLTVEMWQGFTPEQRVAYPQQQQAQQPKPDRRLENRLREAAKIINSRKKPGPSLAGPQSGERGRGPGAGNLSAQLTELWEWARQRARANSQVKVDWLTAQKSLGGHKVGNWSAAVEADATQEHRSKQKTQSPIAERAAIQQVAEPLSKQLRVGQGTLDPPRLTKEFWDSLLTQRDPTTGLRDIALRSLMYSDRGDGSGPQPVDPSLWWMERLVRIKWGGGAYLPQNLRRGEEGAPVQGEKVLINHCIQVVAQAPCRLRVRWAALLHDVGKPDTVALEGNKLTFKAHERVGAMMVDRILSAYGYDDKFCKEVATLVLRSGRIRLVESFHDQGARRLLATPMLTYADVCCRMLTSHITGARRLLTIMGPLFDDLLDLYAADCTSARAHRQAEHQARADMLSQHVKAVLDRDRITSLRPPLNGHDIMRVTGLRAGMQLGRLVRALRADFLRRGPYSPSEAYEVVERLHSQLADIRPSVADRRGRYRKQPLFDAEEQGRRVCWVPLSTGTDDEGEQRESEEVLVFRLRLDLRRSRLAQKVAVDAGKGAWEDGNEWGEVFRDVAVRRDTSLYTLAKIVSHAFDFDFDDEFAFYRRRRGLECPGAEAAYSGIPARPQVEAAEEEAEALRRITHTSGEEPLLEHTFELLARASGSSLRCLNADGFAFRWDVWPNALGECRGGGEGTAGLAARRPRYADMGGTAGLQWRPEDQDHPEDLLDDAFLRGEPDSAASSGGGESDGAESLSSSGVESLSYPLRLPHSGPASLVHTLVGNLFDRSRRSLVYALYSSGPWYIKIDFVEARARKHYETSLPCVTARLGHAPRFSSLPGVRSQDDKAP